MVKKSSLILLAICLLPLSVVWGAYPSDIQTIAGQGVPGYEDGANAEAKFNFPYAAAVAEDGTIYVSDMQNHRIRKIAPNGETDTVAGSASAKDAYGNPIGGFEDGEASAARFQEPRGLAVTGDGTIYVADSGNGAVREIDPDGTVTTLVQGLNAPSDVVVDANGNIFVSDTLNHRIIRIARDGSVQTVAGGGYGEENGFLIGGYKDGQGETAQFNEPTGLALTPNGTLVVSDSGNQRIRAVDPEGNVTTLAGGGTETIPNTSYIAGGFADGFALEARFNFPAGLTVNERGEIFVADQYNHRIRKITPEGKVETVAGSGLHGEENGYDLQAAFDGPSDVVWLNPDRMLVVDQWNHVIRERSLHPLPEEAQNAEQLQVVLDQQLISFDVQPRIAQGRTVLPVRQVGEALGYELGWDEATGTVTLTKGEQTIEMKIGEPAIAGDVTMDMDVAPFIENGRTMVPLRFVAEAFDIHVFWVSEYRTVVLRQ